MKIISIILIVIILSAITSEAFAKTKCNKSWYQRKILTLIAPDEVNKADRRFFLIALTEAKVLNTWVENCKNTKKVIKDLSNYETSLSLYKMDNYYYPTTEQGLNALYEKTRIEPLPRRFPDDGYASPVIDPWGQNYILISPGKHGKFDLYSAGPDGIRDTPDDIGFWNLSDYM